MPEKNTSISRMLRRRYILALSLVALLLLLSQIIIQATIYLQEDDSRVINIAGRQRMLSQRINKAAFGLYISENTMENKRYYKELKTSLALWERSHNGLLNGDEELGLPGKNSKQINKMFERIETPYKNVAGAAHMILEINKSGNLSKADLQPMIITIQKNEQLFLRGMDAIVFQYDAEAKAKTNLIRIVEVLLLVCILITLALEVLFIFRPAERQIEKAIQKLNASRSNLQKLFETAPSPMFLLDADDLTIISMNNKAMNMLNINAEKLSQINFKDVIPSENGSLDELLQILSSEASMQNSETIIKIGENENLIVLLSSSIIDYEDKRTILLGLSDITRLKEAEEVLKRYATIDEMTGFLNKRSGMLVLANCFERSKMLQKELTIAFIDMDGLKSVNDTYGHDEGDFYIKLVAEAIDMSTKSSDSIFRFGGDEFVLIFEGCDQDEVSSIMYRINGNLVDQARQSGKTYQMGVSCGLASRLADGLASADDLLQRADKEMYVDKKRNCP